MYLSVVVSAYSLDRYHDLIDVLDGLSKQTYESFDTTVIIDKNKELFSRINKYIEAEDLKNVNLIFNPENKGLSHSRNIGIENSRGDIVAFIDDDAVPSEDWAKNIIETFGYGKNIGAVTGDILPFWEDESMSWFPKELHWMISCSYIMTPTTITEIERGFGTNMAFKREVFNKVGMFNPSFGINGKKWVGGEDTDAFLRVKKTGMKVIFNPEIRVHHKIYRHRTEIESIIKRAFNGGYSVALMKKHLNYNISNSTEHLYLSHILLKFYPSLLSTLLYSPILNFKKAFLVTAVLFCEFMGYIAGYFEKS